MSQYKIKQIDLDEYDVIRKLDRDAFEYNERDSDGDFHEVFADNIRRSPYYIPELDLIAVAEDGLTYLGHALFSKLPMGDNGEHIVWLHSLAVKHGENDDHTQKSYEYQRKGIGTALVMRGLAIAESLGYTGCMTCGHPDVYRKKMGFLDYRKLGIGKDKSVEEPDGALHAIELVPNGFDKTNKLVSEDYYDFSLNEQGINPEKLKEVLSKMFGKKITRAACQTEQLHGGTVGDVRIVEGDAETADGVKLPYKLVLKTQKKWERYGDPNSWRREYDFYKSDFDTLFSESFRWAECYHAEMNADENETQLWMEYIDGVSGLDMTADMYERAAEELGRFQGKLYAEQPAAVQNLTNLSKVEFMKNFYLHYRSWKEVYDYIRADDCEIPKHLCEILICIDENSDEVFKRIEKLPVILCHRDFWVTNIFYTDSGIRLIDWDTAGWGFMGEDMASLIADEADVEHMVEYYRLCVPAYYKGFSEYADLSHITDKCVYELILVMFGYRMVEWYKFAETPEDKALHLNTMQKVYEMRDIQL